MKTLVVLSGLPASGKSTWARSRVERFSSALIEEDAVREAIFGSTRPPSMKGVYEAMVKAATGAFLAHDEVIFERVAPLDHDRLYPIEKIHGYDRSVLVLFEAEVEECLTRNRARPEERRVPDSVICFLAKEFRLPSTSTAERFDRVYHLRGDGLPSLIEKKEL